MIKQRDKNRKIKAPYIMLETVEQFVNDFLQRLLSSVDHKVLLVCLCRPA